MNNDVTISKLIAATFAIASQKNPGLHQTWVRISHRLGGLLPDSGLMMSIQQDGNLDMLLRAIEDEQAAAGIAALETDLAEPHYQLMLSELWIGRFYEHLRLLTERELLPKDGQVGALAADFRLLRVPIEKHEITSDRKLDAPLQMARLPGRGDASDIYIYDKGDPLRAHILPRGASQRGSIMWQVIDLKSNDKQKWIERRTLSERVVQLWGAEKPTSLSL